MSGEPNKRVQDGVKDYMLCRGCEDLFQKEETVFANEIYHPHLDDIKHVFILSESTRRFATSVSWRIAAYELAHKQLGHIPLQARQRLGSAMKVWGDYLLKKRSDVGPYAQHLILWGLIESVQGTVPNNKLNAYSMRAVDLDVAHHPKGGFVYANLAGFFIVGSFGNACHRWEGTLIEEGQIIGESTVVDQSFGTFIQERASYAYGRLNSMSNRQSELIASFISENPDLFLASETFDAVRADTILSQ